MKEAKKKYRQTDKGKTTIKKYNQSSKERIVAERYRKSDKGRMAFVNKRKKYALDNPEKIKAVDTLNNAIRAGRINREPCEFCNTGYKVEAHHYDYNQPLNVMWLCKQGHMVLHEVML